MAVNKVEVDGETKLDLTADTVTPETLLKGATAHNAAGEAITGTLEASVSTDWAAIAMQNTGASWLYQMLAGGYGSDWLGLTGIHADAFQDTSMIEMYSGGLLFRDKRLEVAPVCPSSATVSFGEGEKEFNAEIIASEVSTTGEWVDLFTFRPDGYCTVSKLTLQTISTATAAASASVKLSIWKSQTKLKETSLGEITHSSDGTEPAVEFTVSQSLDPNFVYTMKLWIQDKPAQTATLSYVKFDVTPSSYNSGTATCSAVSLLSGAKRVKLLVFGSIYAPTVYVRFAGMGSFTTLSSQSIADVTFPNGTKHKLREYAANIPEGATVAQVRIWVSRYSSNYEVYGYALIQMPEEPA